MNEDRKTKKRAHELEMANLRNITEKLREERNDAQIKIQVQQRLLTAASDIMKAADEKVSDDDLSTQIQDWLEKISAK